MNKILESVEFGIILTEDKDYEGRTIYRLRHGGHYDTFTCLRQAIKFFNNFLSNALDCQGY